MSDTPTSLSDQERDALFRRVSAAMQSGDMANAHALAEGAIAAGAEHPYLLKVKGIALHNLGRYQEAIRALHHARTLSPGDPYILNAIASCLTFMGGADAALKVVNESLDLAPEAPGTQYLKGWVLEALHDFQGARTAYQKAVDQNPENVQALAGLASAAAQIEDFAAAREYAQRALTRVPGQPTATLALARAEMAAGETAEAEARLQQMLKDRSRLPLSAITMGFGLLGDVLDAQDRTGEAFTAYLERARALDAAQRQAIPDAPSPAQTVAGLAERLTEMAPGSWQVTAAGAAPDPASPRAHVFLLGFLRSGTTLLEQILATHPDVVEIEEHGFLHAPATTHLASPDAMERFAALDESGLEPLRAAYWDQVSEAGVDPAGKTFVDKDPLNTAKLPLIAKLFPNAKILFAIRDPRDVVLSCFRQHFVLTGETSDLVSLEGTARLYAATMGLADAARAKLPLNVHEHRYEALVSDFDATVQAVCAFVGIEWTKAMRDFADHAAGRIIRSASAGQVRRPLYGEAIGQWRRYAGQMAEVRPLLEPWVRRFGYPEE